MGIGRVSGGVAAARNVDRGSGAIIRLTEKERWQSGALSGDRVNPDAGEHPCQRVGFCRGGLRRARWLQRGRNTKSGFLDKQVGRRSGNHLSLLRGVEEVQ